VQTSQHSSLFNWAIATRFRSDSVLRPRRSNHTLRSRVGANLDRFVLYTAGFSEPTPEVARAQVRLLRPPFAGCGVLIVVAVVLQLWCLAKGCYLLLQGSTGACAPLYHWLLGYCVALLVLLLYFPLVGPLVVEWAVNGSQIRNRLASTSCQQELPNLWEFVDEVMCKNLVTCAMVLTSLVLLWVFRWRVRQVEQLLGGTGSTSEAVLLSVISDPDVLTPLGSECSICLSEHCATGGWRRLPCKHIFHKTCLVEWLQRSRCCPLCRRDLHCAYFVDGLSSASSSTATLSSISSEDILASDVY